MSPTNARNQAIGYAKKLVSDSLSGVGALKGAPCEVVDQKDDDELERTVVTLSWEDSNGDTQTQEVYIPYGKQGEQGENGLSIQSVEINDDNELVFELEDGTQLPGVALKKYKTLTYEGDSISDFFDTGYLEDLINQGDYVVYEPENEGLPVIYCENIRIDGNNNTDYRQRVSYLNEDIRQQIILERYCTPARKDYGVWQVITQNDLDYEFVDINADDSSLTYTSGSATNISSGHFYRGVVNNTFIFGIKSVKTTKTEVIKYNLPDNIADRVAIDTDFGAFYNSQFANEGGYSFSDNIITLALLTSSSYGISGTVKIPLKNVLA
jgi:hypothetical protein